MIRSLLNGGDFTEILLGILYMIPAILVSLSFHEWGHAFVAYKCGDPTARNIGRMTINPLAHLDPIGFAALLLAGFGWAKPVPINPRNFKSARRDEILVSLAGVTVNLILLFISTFVLCLLLFVFNVYNEIAINFIIPFLTINAVLFIFNLIPIPPLDGFHILKCILIKKTGPAPFMFIERYGMFILMILLFTGATSGIISGGATLLMSGVCRFFGLFFPGLPIMLGLA